MTKLEHCANLLLKISFLLCFSPLTTCNLVYAITTIQPINYRISLLIQPLDCFLIFVSICTCTGMPLRALCQLKALLQGWLLWILYMLLLFEPLWGMQRCSSSYIWHTSLPQFQFCCATVCLCDSVHVLHGPFGWGRGVRCQGFLEATPHGIIFQSATASSPTAGQLSVPGLSNKPQLIPAQGAPHKIFMMLILKQLMIILKIYYSFVEKFLMNILLCWCKDKYLYQYYEKRL